MVATNQDYKMDDNEADDYQMDDHAHKGKRRMAIRPRVENDKTNA